VRGKGEGILIGIGCWFTPAVCLPVIWLFAGAQEPEPTKPVRVELGLGTWVSVDDNRWSHNAFSIFLMGNPTSRLTYGDHSTNVVEFTAKVSIRPRWFGRLNIRGAYIDGGRLIDDDFLAPDRSTPSLRIPSEISRSGMCYLNADAGAKF